MSEGEVQETGGSEQDTLVVQGSYSNLLCKMSGGPGHGTDAYERPRALLEAKLTGSLIETGRDLTRALSQQGEQMAGIIADQGEKTAALTKSLVRLNLILVILTVILVVLGGAAILPQAWLWLERLLGA